MVMQFFESRNGMGSTSGFTINHSHESIMIGSRLKSWAISDITLSWSHNGFSYHCRRGSDVDYTCSLDEAYTNGSGTRWEHLHRSSLHLRFLIYTSQFMPRDTFLVGPALCVISGLGIELSSTYNYSMIKAKFT